MSQIRIMNTSTLVTLEGKFCSDPQPGDMIRYYMAPKSLGTVVEKIDKNEVKVLWNDFHDNFESTFRNPDSLNYTQLAKDIFPVQTMSQGAIPFYLDNMIKKEEK